ncbi:MULTISPECIES: hypothetical protein [unclassified Microcoleus]
MGNWAWGMGHGAWGIGHGGWGIGHWEWGINFTITVNVECVSKEPTD